MAYELWVSDGSRWFVADDGAVILDGTRGYVGNYPDPLRGSSTWRVLGLGKRHHSSEVQTLNQIAKLNAPARKAAIGQGWVHDEDHKTHRVWGHARVTHVYQVSDNEVLAGLPFPYGRRWRRQPDAEAQ